MTGIGFPHSDSSGSKPVSGSPKLFAAYHVLHRLPAPRHPPTALRSLTINLGLFISFKNSQLLLCCNSQIFSMCLNIQLSKNLSLSSCLSRKSGTRSPLYKLIKMVVDLSSFSSPTSLLASPWQSSFRNFVSNEDWWR